MVLIFGAMAAIASSIVKTLELPNTFYLALCVPYLAILYYLVGLEYVFRKRQRREVTI